MSSRSETSDGFSQGSTNSPGGSPYSPMLMPQGAFSQNVQDGRPSLRITVQPQRKVHLRYMSERMGVLIKGFDSLPKQKTFPTVELLNYKGPAFIKCQIYQCDNDFLHHHKLVEDGYGNIKNTMVPTKDGSYQICFSNLRITKTKSKEAPEFYYKKLKESSNLSESEIRAKSKLMAQRVDSHTFRLRFSAHDFYSHQEICSVFSKNIKNKKSPNCNDLHIYWNSAAIGCPNGGDNLILLVSQVDKKDIKVRFFEEKKGVTVWETYAHIEYIHYQFAIVIRIPAYKNTDIWTDVKVCIELQRSDNETSESIEFIYKPDPVKVAAHRHNNKNRRLDSLCSVDNSCRSSFTSFSQQDTPIDQNPLDYRASVPQIYETPEGYTVHLKSPIRPPSSYCDILTSHPAEIPVPRVGHTEPPTEKKESQNLSQTYEKQESSQPLQTDIFAQIMDYDDEQLIGEIGNLTDMETLQEIEQEPETPEPIANSGYPSENLPAGQASPPWWEHFGNAFLADTVLGNGVGAVAGGLNGHGAIATFTKLYLTGLRSDALNKYVPHVNQPSQSVKNIGNSLSRENVITVNKEKEKQRKTAIFASQLIKEIAAILKRNGPRSEVRQKLELLFDNRDENGDTFLHQSIRNTFSTNVEKIIKLVHAMEMTHLLHLTNDLQQTILHLAVIYNNYIDLLISKDCDPMIEDEKGYNVVHYAVMRRTTLKPLLDAVQKNKVACDLNAYNLQYQTALHMAVLYDSERCVQLLLQHGANHDARDSQGRTALHLAVCNGRLGIVRTILEFIPSSDVDAVDLRNYTALQIACYQEMEKNTLAMIGLLLQNKADPTKHLEYTRSAWDLAKYKSQIRSIMKNYMPDDYESSSESGEEDESVDEDETEDTLISELQKMNIVI